jgi:threonine synthase
MRTSQLMDHIVYLECMVCGKQYDVEDVEYVCPDHGLDGVLDVIYEYDRIGASFPRQHLAADFDHNMWRYRPLLPIEAHAEVPRLHVGWTPMWQVSSAGDPYGLHDLWVKDDGRNPTGSLKDRASAMAITKAKETGAAVITTASTGNAAAALAGLAAAEGLPVVIFVPRSAPEAKIAQLLAYGARVFLVDGSYDDAFMLCVEASKRFGWYNRNTGYNPYMSEGKKTAAFEIAEQLNWEVPDAVIVSVGDGCIIGGLYKGFHDLNALGWIEKMPRLIGVQASGSNFLEDAWERGEDVLTKAPIAASSVADSIVAGLPADRLKAMRAVKFTEGGFVEVSDDEILAAIPAMARQTGVFAEPAAAAAYAGLVGAIAEDLLAPEDRVVILSTGTGLKDAPAAMRGVASVGIEGIVIEPTLDAVERAMAG